MINELDTRLKYNLENLKERTKKQEELRIKTEEHQKLFRWEKYREIRLVEKAFEEFRQLQKNLKLKEGELEKLTRRLAQNESDRERYKGEVEKIGTQLTVHRTEVKMLNEQLVIISPEQFHAQDN